MKERLNLFLMKLDKELWLILGISVGIFLFVLIFKPFPVDQMDFNNTTLFKIGLAAIVFLIIVIVRIIYPCLMENNSSRSQEVPLYSIMSGFIIWLLSSVVFSFYIHEAGIIHPTFYHFFKIALICLAPPVILRIYDRISLLKQRNEALLLERKIIEKVIDKEEDDNLNILIEFTNIKNRDLFSLLISDILLFKSANNYVEVHYQHGDIVKKKLVRNTFRNITQQMNSHPDFIRCHRTCMINVRYIEKFNGNCNQHALVMRGYNKPIPVSRQYFLKIKEAI